MTQYAMFMGTQYCLPSIVYSSRRPSVAQPSSIAVVQRSVVSATRSSSTSCLSESPVCQVNRPGLFWVRNDCLMNASYCAASE